MVETMVPELKKFYVEYWSYKMGLDLAEKFHKRAHQEKYEVIKALMVCKLKEGESACNHVQRMQRYVEHLERINVNFDEELVIDIILNSLSSCYDQFILTYHLNNTKTILAQFHNFLQTTESGMKKNQVPSAASAPILVIGKK